MKVFILLLLSITVSFAQRLNERRSGFLFVLNVTVTPPAGEGDIIPSERLFEPNNAGVVGGIDHRTTQSSTHAAGASTATIQAAIDAASSNQYVNLEAGTFTLTGLNMKRGVTIRGASPGTASSSAGATILDMSGSINFTESAGTYNRQSVTINSGSTKGSTTVTLSGPPTDLTVGSVAIITELNDTNFVNQYGFEAPVPDGWSLDATFTMTYKKTIPDSPVINRVVVEGVDLVARASETLVNANAGSYFYSGGVMWLRLFDDSDPDAHISTTTSDHIGFGLLCSYCDENASPQGARTRGQGITVTTISGNDVTFTPALYSNFTNTARIEYAASLGLYNVMARAGFENLRLKTHSGVSILMDGARDCWVSNVIFEVRNASVSTIKTYYTKNITIQHCGAIGQVNQADFILSQINSFDTMILDNWGTETSQFITFVGRNAGHFIGYNYENSETNGGTALISTITGHGTHPEFLIFEGNKGFKAQPDNIHGSGRFWTFFRSYFKGEEPGKTTFGAGCINVDSWNTKASIVGCVLGYPSMTGFTYEKDTDSSGSVKTLLSWGFAGYSQLEYGPDVKALAIVHGNYDYVNNAIVWDAGISNHTLSNSLKYASKPSFIGAGAWPPIGHDTTGKFTNEIPAQYRFRTGNEL